MKLNSFKKFTNEAVFTNGYIQNPDDALKTDDDGIKVLVPGYGVLSFGQVKRKVATYLEDMAKEAKKGKFNNIISHIHNDDNGVFLRMVEVLAGVEGELEEIKRIKKNK